MKMISTVYQGEKRTVDVENLIIEDSYCHRMNREDLYRALVKLKCPDIQPCHGIQDLSFIYGVWRQRELEKTNGK